MRKVLILFLLCLAVQTRAGHDAVLLDAGVPQALAQQRAQDVQDVAYSLAFSLPASEQELVKGKAVLSFIYKGRQGVVLDFQGQEGQLDDKCLVNGSIVKTCWQQEHIIIEHSVLRSGRNEIAISFKSGNKSLNRNPGYMYTLFVPDHARSVFPCFDQPDIKARYTLCLTMPKGWKAMSTGRIEHKETHGDNVKVAFAQTEPLPTYLFSFVAGQFEERQATRQGHAMRMLYRETDPQKVAQIDDVFDMAAFSINWLEQYTGIKQPFSQYGMVVLPGYQFGGMEHPGAIQFNANTIFLGNNPTPDEQLKRFELIAHETAHLWFGDMVTMRWFDDVWTKEVFANLMAAKMSRSQYSNINHDLNFLKMYQTGAMATDRTAGTHPIQQPLANLNQAGLLYGNIIYNKAPVMMRKLEQLMGQEAFKQGVRRYLELYKYANSTWDNLIDILSQQSPGAGIKEFSHVWVKQKGMPHISTSIGQGCLEVRQTDPLGRGLLWHQSFKVRLLLDMGQSQVPKDTVVQVDMSGGSVRVPLHGKPLAVWPNSDGSGYGLFHMDVAQVMKFEHKSSLERFAMLAGLYENYVAGRFTEHTPFTASQCYEQMCAAINDANPLLASAACGWAWRLLCDMPRAMRQREEPMLLIMALQHKTPAIHQRLLRLLGTGAMTKEVNNTLYNIWSQQSDTLLSERDYMQMVYHLAVMRPSESNAIVARQAQRLTGADRCREFAFVAKACQPDTAAQDSVFAMLQKTVHRAVEPWAAQALALLNHPNRQPASCRFIEPALAMLPEIQRTGDIFFPANWLRSLLSSYSGDEARNAVRHFIEGTGNMQEPLMNKLKENSYYLLNDRGWNSKLEAE